MSEVVTVLRQELATLEAELVTDPRYRKLAKIRELLAIYETREPAQPRKIEPEAQSETPTKADRIRAETRAIIERSGGIAHRQDILNHLTRLGIMGAERSPMTNLAAYLSEMKEFASAGSGNWTIRSDVTVRAARRRKIVHEHIPGSATARIVDFSVRYLREKGARAQAPEIVSAMRERGIEGMDVDAVSSALSHSALFDNIRGQGYGLTGGTQQFTETETPSSRELLGAPRPNGGVPLDT
jgi:hypothetical protein